MSACHVLRTAPAPARRWFLPSTALVAYYTAQGAKVTAEIHDGGHDLRQTDVQALARHFWAQARSPLRKDLPIA